MSNNKSEDYIDQIIDIINWYGDLPEDYTEVNELMFTRQKLSALVFNYSRLAVAVLVEDFKNAQAVTENKKFQLRVRHQSKGVVQARNISKANTEQELITEKKLEGLYMSARHMEKSMYEVLDSMNQHISHLKEELKFYRYSNQQK